MLQGPPLLSAERVPERSEGGWVHLPCKAHTGLTDAMYKDKMSLSLKRAASPYGGSSAKR